MIPELIAGVEPNQPITRIINANVHVRPDNGGLRLGIDRLPQTVRAGVAGRGFEPLTFRL
jgi:hypothetical protein